jgi:hypothetical protein
MVRTALRAVLALCLASACSQDDSASLGDPVRGERGGGADGFELVRGGRVHQAELAASLGPSADPALLLAAVEKDLTGELGALDPADFSVRRDTSSARPAGGSLRHVDLVQTADGVPIHGTYLQLTVAEDAGGARLVGSSYRVYTAGRRSTPRRP